MIKARRKTKVLGIWVSVRFRVPQSTWTYIRLSCVGPQYSQSKWPRKVQVPANGSNQNGLILLPPVSAGTGTPHVESKLKPAPQPLDVVNAITGVTSTNKLHDELLNNQLQAGFQKVKMR